MRAGIRKSRRQHRAQWDWGNGQWNWVPGHYERERVGHHWRERRWENRDGVYVNVDGACFVSIDALADDTELAADTVRKRLAWLESIGAIARLPQWVDASGRRNGEGRGKRTTDEIRLLLSVDARRPLTVV